METDYKLIVEYMQQMKKEGIYTQEKIGVLNSNGTILPYPFIRGMAVVYKKGSIEGKVTISAPLQLQENSKKIKAVHIHNFQEKYVQKMNSK